MAVFRYIFKHAANRLNGIAVHIAHKGFADCAFHAAHLFGQRAGDHDIIRTRQHIFRVTDKYRTRENIEKAGIGQQKGCRVELFFGGHY